MACGDNELPFLATTTTLAPNLRNSVFSLESRSTYKLSNAVATAAAITIARRAVRVRPRRTVVARSSSRANILVRKTLEAGRLMRHLLSTPLRDQKSGRVGSKQHFQQMSRPMPIATQQGTRRAEFPPGC